MTTGLLIVLCYLACVLELQQQISQLAVDMRTQMQQANENVQYQGLSSRDHQHFR